MSWFISDSRIDYSGKGVCSHDFDGPKRCTFRFRLLDDDGLVYYYGFSSAESFAPLDDFGMPEAGCTEIQYHNPKTMEWETL